jgi:hypothetical protein
MGMREREGSTVVSPAVTRTAILPVACCVLLLSLSAAPIFGATVSTVEFALIAEPQDHAEVTFTLLNDESDPLSFALEIVDWDDDPDGVTRTFAPGELGRSCSGWILAEPSSGRLEPSEEVPILVGIDVPKAEPGTHWAGILVSVWPESGTVPGEGSDLEVLRRFLVRIYVTIQPTTTSGRVVALHVGGLHPFGASIRFENTGNARLVGVNGTVSVEDSRGTVLLDLPIAPFDVLPEHSADVRTTAPWEVLDAGAYWVRAVLDFGADYLVAGQTLVRIPALSLEPIGEAVGVPMDLDGDGLYEDVDGNGTFDVHDPELLRAEIDSPAIQQNARAFDFDDDGLATPADADLLLEWVWRTP